MKKVNTKIKKYYVLGLPKDDGEPIAADTDLRLLSLFVQRLYKYYGYDKYLDILAVKSVLVKSGIIYYIDVKTELYKDTLQVEVTNFRGHLYISRKR